MPFSGSAVEREILKIVSQNSPNDLMRAEVRGLVPHMGACDLAFLASGWRDLNPRPLRPEAIPADMP